MSNLKILRNGQNWPFKSFNFPAGEVGIKLEISPVAFASKTGLFAPISYQTIIARIGNSNDIMELIMVVDALRRIDNTAIRLLMPYTPYSRQDRVCDCGEAFSLKAFATLINSLKFESICIIDPHSNVCDAVFDNLQVITQFDIINSWTDFIKRVGRADLVSPDAGSNKKVSILAGYFNRHDFIRADKLRDLTNGEIKETIVYRDDLKGADVCIIDDICDGGRTFTELAKVLKRKNSGKVILYVTHGIFSKGTDILFENGIDEIWTTDSFNSPAISGIKEENKNKIHIFKLEEKIEI